jgi:hypothetical protein
MSLADIVDKTGSQKFIRIALRFQRQERHPNMDDLPETVYTDQALKHAMIDGSGAKVFEALVNHVNAMYLYQIKLEGRIDVLEDKGQK